jgi:hypothetical protein
MKPFRIFLALVALSLPACAQERSPGPQKAHAQAGGGALIYAQGGAFMVTGPKGWTMDNEVGQRLGTCCVYYPEGSTWDDAETVLYPSIASKGTGQQTLEEFMKSDLEDFRDHNPGMSFEDGDDIPLKNGRAAKLRYFYNVNRGSSEAVAYINEQKIVALVVMSSRTKRGLSENLPLLKAALLTYAFMDVRFANGAEGKSQSSEIPKD